MEGTRKREGSPLNQKNASSHTRAGPRLYQVQRLAPAKINPAILISAALTPLRSCGLSGVDGATVPVGIAIPAFLMLARSSVDDVALEVVRVVECVFECVVEDVVEGVLVLVVVGLGEGEGLGLGEGGGAGLPPGPPPCGLPSPPLKNQEPYRTPTEGSAK